MAKLHIEIHPYTLHFKRPAGTSRGVYTTRKVWYLHLTSTDYPGRTGIGECAPLPDLSCEAGPDYEQNLYRICSAVMDSGTLEVDRWRQWPSILFGLETAFRHIITGNQGSLWNTPFSRGEEGIPINGLIWMGSYERMFEQIEQKLAQGYHCVKLKIGAIDFERELDLLQFIRKSYSKEKVELRVDANGAFPLEHALDHLHRLAALQLHSIEQPIRAGQWLEMASLTRQTPLPIALDEELIGVHTIQDKQRLLDTIAPQYIILKPSLHGGISGCEEWIKEAELRHIGWWITSALESNVGLNAIAQWCATLGVKHPQGLGTGSLFTDNISMPLEVKGDALWIIK